MKGSLGALQTHLSPVCDGLQLHGVTAVLLQSLQFHPALSLQQWKTLACWLRYVTTLSLGAPSLSSTIVPVTAPAPLGLGQPGPCGEAVFIGSTCGAGQGLTARRWASGSCEGAVLSEPPTASSPVFDLQHSTVSVSSMNSCY